MIPSKTNNSSISSELLEALKKQGSIKTFGPGEVILDESEYIKFIPIVLAGSIKVMRQDDEGREILLYYIRPGESCVMSFLGAISNSSSKIKAVVEDEAEVLVVPVDKAITLIRDNPRWLEFIFQLYNKRFEELLSVVNAIAFQKVDARLWDLLLKKAAASKTSDLVVTHQQLADELGTAREVVSRLLKELERQKQIALSRNRIKILAGL